MADVAYLHVKFFTLPMNTGISVYNAVQFGYYKYNVHALFVTAMINSWKFL